MRVPFDVAFRATESVRGLLDRQILDVSEDDDGTLHGRERGDGGQNVMAVDIARRDRDVSRVV